MLYFCAKLGRRHMNQILANLHFFKQLIIRLGIMLMIFTILKLIFFVFNMDLFPVESGGQIFGLLFYALRFDISALIYINSLFIILSLLPFPIRENEVYKKTQKIVFFIINGIAIIFELVDVGFYKFAFRRTIGSDLDLFSNTASMIPGFITEYWFLPLMFLIIMALMYFFYKRTNFEKPEENFPKRIQISIFITGSLLFLIAARGGLQLRPIMPVAAFQYTDDSRLAPLINNTCLNLLFSAQQEFLEEKKYLSEEKQNALFTTKRQYHSGGKMKQKNVFLIVLESFGQEHISRYHPNLKTTPFLDSLFEKSFYLKQSYANALRSTKGIVSITSGIPALMNAPLMFSAYQSNRIDGIAKLLGDQGYKTSFFHGANPGSMGFERFSKLSGFQEYHDRLDFNNDLEYDGQWGIWDDPLFQYSANQVNEYQQPFCALMFSLTSHHPYKTPDWFEKEHPNMEPIHRSVRYTDYALQSFFETAQKMDWYENTIFVITADHIGQSVDNQYNTRNGRYKIPILIFDPKQEIRGQQKGIAEQIDIMPTVLDLLDYNQPFASFGESMLDSSRTNLSVQFNSDIYQILDENYLLLFDEEKTIGLYKYKTDVFLQNNLMDIDSINYTILEESLKARIQVHHKGMIWNELY